MRDLPESTPGGGTVNTTSGTILTGMRPTGPLHLGHYFGALENWLKLQSEYRCNFLIADYQALGDYADDVNLIRSAVRDVTLDWLSVGLDPDDANFVVQSYVPEHAELAMLLGMIAKLGELNRNPTLKSETARIEATGGGVSVGFYTYPVSQAADILLSRADLVPVGEDQLPHVEYTRLLARRFNTTYSDVFSLPDALLGRVSRLRGLDGRAKMSKSLGNAIYLSDDATEVRLKVRRMRSDATGRAPRMTSDAPGIVETNPAFDYLDAIRGTEDKEVAELKARYRRGGVGDGAVKDFLCEVLNAFLDPIRARRAEILEGTLVENVLREGSARQGAIAAETMQCVRDAMGISRYE